MPAIRIHISLTALILLSLTAAIASAGLSYMDPPAPLVDMVDAPPTPGVSLSPDGQWMLLMDRKAMPSVPCGDALLFCGCALLGCTPQ